MQVIKRTTRYRIYLGISFEKEVKDIVRHTVYTILHIPQCGKMKNLLSLKKYFVKSSI